MSKATTPEPITWEPKKVLVEELKENPTNPKTITEYGKERLHKSLSKFGLAGTIVVNQDLSLIDGHSRKRDMQEAGIKEVWVSVPSRQLSDEEYKEFNAIFDLAKAADSDIFMVENLLTEEQIEEWDIHGENKKKKKGAGGGAGGDEVEARYPLIPQYDEKHEAIIILCSNSIDTTFIKNCLDIGYAMSYKNKNVRETSVVTAAKFIEKWKEAQLKSK